MIQQNNYAWRVRTKLLEGIPRRTSTIDCQIYIDKRRTQYAWHSYSTLASLTDHYKCSHYVDLTKYSDERDGMRLRQSRYLAKSDTFSTYSAGDIAIATTHTECLIRFKRLMRKSQVARRMDATAIALTNMALRKLSPERRYEILVRFNLSQLQEIYGINSQKANELRGLGPIQTHQILFTSAPVDYSYLSTPLDTLLFNLKNHFKNLLRDHKRFNFSHDTRQVSFLKSDYSLSCRDCHGIMPKQTSPPSLLELSAFYLHKRVCVCHQTAFMQKAWLDKLGLPELLKRMVYDFKMIVCPREGASSVGACNFEDCSICKDYRHCYNRIGMYIDHSNSEMRHRHSELKRLPRKQWNWPLLDFGEVGSIFKSYPSDENKFLYNLCTNQFLTKMELHGQMYGLEVTDGEHPIRQDEASLRRVRTRIRPMLQYSRIAPDLWFSLKQSEVWIFCPISRDTPREEMFFKATVKNFGSGQTRFDIK